MATSTKPAVVEFKDFATLEGSITLMKELTTIGISTIAYCRNLFENSDFVKKNCEGATVFIIKGSEDNEAHCLRKWLKGAFDALEKNYLKTLILEIRDGDHRPRESYAFEYVYKENEPLCSMKVGGAAASPVNLQTKNEIKNLLRNIFVMTANTNSENLPPKCYCIMKLDYYTDVTPRDYEPPGFQPRTQEEKLKPTSWRVGKVQTSFHEVSVKFRDFQH